MNKVLKGVVIGAGYFSHFHYDAWDRISEVQISALCDINEEAIKRIVEKYEIPNQYVDYKEMLLKERPDFVDIVTPPNTHAEITKYAADLGIHVICQKALTPTYKESKELVNYVEKKGVTLVIHENFRFQPWHREIKKIIDRQEIGELFSLNFRSRMGDGWGEDAYLARQPYFRDYKKLLIYETGVHYIDTFRYHGGEIESVYAKLKRLNPVIKGEDAGLLLLDFKSGAHALWDANRYNENNFKKSRYTFGEYLVEGSKGTIRLYSDGKITIQKLGASEREHVYYHSDEGFAGDCCYIFQKDYVNQLLGNKNFETSGVNYLKTIEIQEAAYESAKSNQPVSLSKIVSIL